MPLQQIRHFAPALFILIAFSSVVPESVTAATPPAAKQDATHPVVMQQAASGVAAAQTTALQPFTSAPKLPAIAAAGSQLREVFGFALASSLADPTVGYPTGNFSLLTTVAFFGLHVPHDGTFAADSGSTVWNSSQPTGLLSTAHPSGT